MIGNWSRISEQCRRKSFNWDELRLTSWRDADPLLQGDGFHAGAAELFSTKDPHAALIKVEDVMRKRLEGQLILPEERPQIEHNIEWAKRAVAKFVEHYDPSEVTVLWPEVKFRVPLPNSEHHCFFMHRLLHPDIPYRSCEGEVWMQECHIPHSEFVKCQCGRIKPTCVMPHYFQGRTDAVVQWLGKIWLFEHKTNSMAQDLFIKKFLLDGQATGYLYGIWKSLGVRPEGFILNVIQKPQKNAKDQLSVGFAREPFLRSDEDLTRFATEFTIMCEDYERAFMNQILTGRGVVMNTKQCMSWNRECYYMQFCLRGFVANEDEFRRRDDDYINNAYYEVAGLPIPEHPTKEGGEENVGTPEMSEL